MAMAMLFWSSSLEEDVELDEPSTLWLASFFSELSGGIRIKNKYVQLDTDTCVKFYKMCTCCIINHGRLGLSIGCSYYNKVTEEN